MLPSFRSGACQATIKVVQTGVDEVAETGGVRSVNFIQFFSDKIVDLRRKTSSCPRSTDVFFFLIWDASLTEQYCIFCTQKTWQTHTGPSGVVSPEVGGTAIFPVFFFAS